jgi:tetratricopeptide (TPR) repeat protein
MAASTKSLSSLLAQASIEDHDEVLQATDATLKKSKGDQDAQHVKAVALLYLDRYEDALEVFEAAKELQDKARFEYAYALYKTGNAAKAAEVAGAAGTDAGRGTKHMLAQAVRAGNALPRICTQLMRIRHIVLRTSHKPEESTRSLQINTTKARSTISASTREPWTHN